MSARAPRSVDSSHHGGKSLLNATLLVAGVGGTLAGLGWLGGAGLPYPDPTPALLERQSRDMQCAGVTTCVALVVTAVAVVRLVRSHGR